MDTKSWNKNTKKILKRATVHLTILTGGAVIGLLALILAYTIPVSPMREHISQSLPMLQREFTSSELIIGYPASLTGLFTDCLMLENAVYQSDERSVLEQILYMYRGESSTGDGWAPGESLVDYMEGILQPREVEYARYWHGYLVVLKPLIFLTNFNTIRIMASSIQLVLVAMIVMACGRRDEYFLGKAFLVSMPFLYYFGLYASLSLSICFYLMTGLVLVQLKWDAELRERGFYGIFFLAAGMLTSYFDFLTYPLITLGFPLCVCLYLNKSNARRSLKPLVGYSAEWCGGYGGLWALKWILTDILTGSNVIKIGIDTIFERTGTAADRTRIAGFFTVIKRNAAPYFNWGFILLITGILIWLVSTICKKKKRLSRKILWEGMGLFVIALYPFIWFFFMQNHSEEHWMYTCKILAVTVFAGICWVGKICGCAAE